MDELVSKEKHRERHLGMSQEELIKIIYRQDGNLIRLGNALRKTLVAIEHVPKIRVGLEYHKLRMDIIADMKAHLKKRFAEIDEEFKDK